MTLRHSDFFQDSIEIYVSGKLYKSRLKMLGKRSILKKLRRTP